MGAEMNPFDLSGKVAINISSNILQPLQPGRGVSAVTKAGLTQLTRVLAFAWAQYNASPASDYITGQTIFVDGGSNLI